MWKLKKKPALPDFRHLAGDLLQDWLKGKDLEQISSASGVSVATLRKWQKGGSLNPPNDKFWSVLIACGHPRPEWMAKHEPLLSYEVIAEKGMADPDALLLLGKSGTLDAGSMARIAHWWRFMQHAIDALPDPDMPIQDAFSDEELQKIWQKTADPGADVGKCPLLH